MSYSDFQGGSRTASVADVSVNERTEFIRKTYLHLGGAIFAFTALTAAIINSSLAPKIVGTLMGSQFGWLLVLALYMGVGHFAQKLAYSGSSPSMQYVGLGLFIVAEAIIFTPLLYIATYYTDGNVIPTAGILTLIVFGGLTASVFITKKDFSFMGRALMMGGFAAMGIIVVSILFGFSLGVLFSAAMVVLMAGYVLYETSNVLHHYPVGSHVAASLALFSAVATMFWYILRIVMAFTGDD